MPRYASGMALCALLMLVGCSETKTVVAPAPVPTPQTPTIQLEDVVVSSATTNVYLDDACRVEVMFSSKVMPASISQDVVWRYVGGQELNRSATTLTMRYTQRGSYQSIATKTYNGVTREGVATVNVFGADKCGGLPPEQPEAPDCRDGRDNDGDGKVDHSSVNPGNPDPGCTSPDDNDETDAPPPTPPTPTPPTPTPPTPTPPTPQNIVVTVVPKNPVCVKGSQVNISANVSGTVAGQSTAVTWNVPATGVASPAVVSPNALTVNCNEVGTVRITASSVADPTKSDFADLTVNAAPTVSCPSSIDFTPRGGTIGVNQSLSIALTQQSGWPTNCDVIYLTDRPSILKINGADRIREVCSGGFCNSYFAGFNAVISGVSAGSAQGIARTIHIGSDGKWTLVGVERSYIWTVVTTLQQMLGLQTPPRVTASDYPDRRICQTWQCQGDDR